MGLFSYKTDSQSLDLYYGQAFRHAANSPLSSLLINLELAQNHRDLANNSYLEGALQSAYRLQELFKDPSLLENKRSFFILPFLKESIRLVKHNFPQATITLNTHFQKDSQLWGSRFYFQEAVICVLNNALEAYTINSKSRMVLITGYKNKNRLQLHFTDGGRGLSWIEKSLIFAEGYSHKENGMGIGLTWVKRVIEDHFGGEIKLKSQKKHGTTLSWFLPLKK